MFIALEQFYSKIEVTSQRYVVLTFYVWRWQQRHLPVRIWYLNVNIIYIQIQKFCIPLDPAVICEETHQLLHMSAALSFTVHSQYCVAKK